MRVLRIRVLNTFLERHADATKPIAVWVATAQAATWASIVDVKKTYPTADYVAGYTVFNIKGNKYRLATEISYQVEIIRVHWVGTHAEYDKDEWK